MGDAFAGEDRLDSDGVDDVGDGRNSFGYIGQISYMKPESKVEGRRELRREPPEADRRGGGKTAPMPRSSSGAPSSAS